MALRSFSSASVSGTVRIQVIEHLPPIEDFPYNAWPVTVTEAAARANTRIVLFGAWRDRFIRGLPARRIESMSIVVWKVMRRLPKPLLLALFFFTTVAVCRA